MNQSHKTLHKAYRGSNDRQCIQKSTRCQPWQDLPRLLTLAATSLDAGSRSQISPSSHRSEMFSWVAEGFLLYIYFFIYAPWSFRSEGPYESKIYISSSLSEGWELLQIVSRHGLCQDMRGAVKYKSVMTFKTTINMGTKLIHPIYWIQRSINRIYTHIKCSPNEIKFKLTRE